MDILWFLKQRLDFIDRLYDDSTASFCEKMRKIEIGEQPYVDQRHPEYDDVSEPAFLEEWQDANEAVEVIGYWCLNMVQASLKAFLEEYVNDMANYHRPLSAAKAELAKTKAASWFERYRLFFLNYFHIDWQRGPVNIEDLEHMNLTRDDLTHNVKVTTHAVYQTKKHAERYPKGLFTDEVWTTLGMGGKIKVGRDQLTQALGLLDAFAGWLDNIRINYIAHLRSLARAKIEMINFGTLACWSRAFSLPGHISEPAIPSAAFARGICSAAFTAGHIISNLSC